MTSPDQSPAGRPQPAWRCPDPRRLPELRGKLAGWLAERGAAFYLECLLVGSQQIRPPGPLAAAAARLAANEHRRITTGPLYWVSAEMTDLAQHAGRQLTRHELYEHDLPAARGFMVFETPLAITAPSGTAVEIVAVSWGIVEPPLLIPQEGTEVPIGGDWAQGKAVWFSFYSDPHGFVHTHLSRWDGGATVTWLRQVGPFMPDNDLIWALGQLEELPEGDQLTSAWGRTVVAAWLLMQQPLTAHDTDRAPRPARRRLQRAGLPTDDVQLIHVRRPQRRTTSSPSGPGDREYSVRWWVEGHWRREVHGFSFSEGLS